MSYYDSDYTDEIYERYMHTGEGAEFFEDSTEEENIEDIIIENIEHKDLNKQLDDIIRYLKKQIKEKERIIKTQNKKTGTKKKTTKKR